MSYWRAFYHLVWATKNREALIGAQEWGIVERSMMVTMEELHVIPLAFGFMPDHVHMVVSIPPKVAAAEVVKRLKGASAYAVNHDAGRDSGPHFGWQGGYGLLTFGEKALSQVVEYAENQAVRHAERRLWAPMERDEPER